MIRSLCLLGSLMLLSACTILNQPSNPSRDCNWRERDLTVSWGNRTYWCIPDAVKTKPRVTYEAKK